jgi:peroxiredoxin
MTWVIFDVSDRETAAPSFSLEAAQDGRVSLWDYYEKCNLVLLFLHGKDSLGRLDPNCRQALLGFAARQADYDRLQAGLLALVPEPAPGPAADFPTGQLPFPLLADPGGKTRQKYAALMVASLAPENAVMLFVLDQYGAPYAAYIAPEFEAETLHAEVQSWLQYIGVQCPE